MMTIKNYEKVLTMARQLNPTDRIRLVQALLGSLSTDVVPDTPQRSILELKGLGREIWQNVDVEKYIQEERASWDG